MEGAERAAPRELREELAYVTSDCVFHAQLHCLLTLCPGHQPALFLSPAVLVVQTEKSDGRARGKN